MPLFTYTRDIPDGPNNPSQDQPNMKTNTNSTDDLIEVDHYSFNDANGGLHKQVQMPDLGAIPAGLIANEGTLYVKLADGTSQLFYTNENSGNEYQLTRSDNTNFATFGKLTADPMDLTSSYGWTFLAGNGGNAITPIAATGGLLLFYGTKSAVGITSTINFPFAFPNQLFSITATVAQLVAGNNKRLVITAQSTAGFSVNTVAVGPVPPGLGNVNWMAIGR